MAQALNLADFQREPGAKVACLVVAVLLSVFALYVVSETYSATMQLHMYLIMAFCYAAAFWLMTRSNEKPAQVNADGTPNYNEAVVRYGVAASTIWGVVGFIAGLYIALQLAFPALNLDLPFTTFGRVRPLHTSAVIFAFGGNVLLAASFYVVQRTCRARLAGDIAP
ncbi:MAG: cbb3-type cytochrome c oxidase subunit I, partial [Pseudomonadota bacterium]